MAEQLAEGGVGVAGGEEAFLVREAGMEATYAWDLENRLIHVEKADGTVVEHAYDADGNRVRTEIAPTTGPPTMTEFLVDTSGSLSHVVAETDATGTSVPSKTRAGSWRSHHERYRVVF